MIIFVTDEGRFWNHENPILERYADYVVVVCLNGHAVTDKYTCVVSPNRLNGLGMIGESGLRGKLHALESVKRNLRNCYSYHDDLVFLTDGEPASLLPYVVLREGEKYNRMHLWCMPPWKFEGLNKRNTYFKLLGSLDKLNSIHYIDADAYLNAFDKSTKISEVALKCQEWLNDLLPRALYEIDHILSGRKHYYFDEKVRRYISTNQSYFELIDAEPIKNDEIEAYRPVRRGGTIGMLLFPKHPDPGRNSKDMVEQLYPRLDGKKVCEHMKKLRVQLARANDIPYEPVSCPSTGPCAGTCEQCDMELRYLQEMIQKKDEKERIYPKEESAYRPDEKPFPKPKAEEEHLMGFLRATKPIRTGQVSVEIPEFLKKRRGDRGEGEHHE